MHRFIRGTGTSLLTAGAFVLVSLALVSCNRSLESVTVVVEREDGDRYQSVRVTDLGRRTAEEEAVIVPRTSDRERPFRFRIESAGDQPIRMTAAPGSGAAARVIVTLSGDIRGGALTVHSGDAGQKHSFNSTVSDQRRDQAQRYRLAFPLDRFLESPWEIEFEAPAGSAGYRVEEIRLGYDEPRAAFSSDQGPGAGPGGIAADALMPVTVTDQAVELPNLQSVIRDHSQALLVEYRAGEELFQDRRDRPGTEIILTDREGTDQRIRLMLRPGDRKVPVRPGMWHSGTQSLAIEMVEGLEITGIRPLSIPKDPLEPIMIELEELQGWPRELWRREEFELFAWSLYPNILWTDHRDYGTQSRMFTRLAFFVEKRGYQGRLLTNEQLATRHGWNAHNYRPEGLAEFYNAVDATGFELNGEELILRDIAMARGLLVENTNGGAGERWLPGTGGILSISQDSFPALRRLLTVHEAMHGVFYEEPAFRRVAFDYWDQELAQREREFWQLFFSWMTYDPDDRYLMVNEFQAYLLQQGEANANWYFGTRIADRLRTAQPHRTESINLMLRDYPNTFIRAAAAMNESLFAEAGMVGGDPFCLRPLSE